MFSKLWFFMELSDILDFVIELKKSQGRSGGDKKTNGSRNKMDKFSRKSRFMALKKATINLRI